VVNAVSSRRSDSVHVGSFALSRRRLDTESLIGEYHQALLAAGGRVRFELFHGILGNGYLLLLYQAFRLRQVFATAGPSGLVSQHRGCPSNQRHGASFRRPC
jgi:hypothetical protein